MDPTFTHLRPLLPVTEGPWPTELRDAYLCQWWFLVPKGHRESNDQGTHVTWNGKKLRAQETTIEIEGPCGTTEHIFAFYHFKPEDPNEEQSVFWFPIGTHTEDNEL